MDGIGQHIACLLEFPNSLCIRQSIHLLIHYRNSSGNVTFYYTLSDGVSPISPNATVTITVSPAPTPPVAVNDSYDGVFGQPFTPTSLNQLLLYNDTSYDGGPIVVGVASPPSPQDGNVTVSSSGNFTFTPVTGWSGESQQVSLYCTQSSPPTLLHRSMKQSEHIVSHTCSQGSLTHLAHLHLLGSMQAQPRGHMT